MSTATLRRVSEEALDYWAEDEDELAVDVTEPLLDRVSHSTSDAHADDRLVFDLLADELEAAMLASSSTRRVVREPAYAELLRMGENAIPFLLERLHNPGARPLWLRLLGALTAYQPGAGEATIEDAARQWMRWGRLRGYASP